MPFTDRFRRAIRTDRPGSGSSSNSNSNPDSRLQTATNTPVTSGAATPTPSHRNSTANTNSPTITLTKSKSSHRLSLTKSLTWTSHKKHKEEKNAEKAQKRLEFWEQKDKLEWTTPEDGWRRSGKKRSKQHQDMLRAFEFDFSARRSSVGSWISGISPGQSRVGSVDADAERVRERSEGVELGGALEEEGEAEDLEALGPAGVILTKA